MPAPWEIATAFNPFIFDTMATINFKTQQLANLYSGGSDALHLNFFRTDGTDQQDADIAALDNRIAAFQNAITDGAKAGSEDFPYDKTFLKREFMEEVFANLLKRSNYTEQRVSGSAIYNGSGQQGGDQNGLLKNNALVQTGVGPAPFFLPIYANNDLTNFSDLTLDQMKSVLNNGPNDGGAKVLDTYSAWIDAVFEEGNKMKNNPVGTFQVVTSIIERTLPSANSPNVVYDRVSSVNTGVKDPSDPTGATFLYRYFLIAKGAPMADVAKLSVNGSLNVPADSVVGVTPGVPANSVYIEVDKDLNPLVNNAFGFVNAATNLSPMRYLYFFNEARVRILRGQLNMKEAVTTEIRDDLAKANAAYADLEKQAGATRAQSADGKTMNPDLSYETSTMDFFEATNSARGEQIFLNEGNDDLNRYSEWGANRSQLKTYIDRKSTQSQDAMLDYQTTLNRYNNAYDVMSKLQEKLDGLVKSQLRNV